MQEIKRTGEQILTDNRDLNNDKIIGALNDRDNQTVAFHKPGSIITHSDGKQYRVDERGAWRKIEEAAISSALNSTPIII